MKIHYKNIFLLFCYTILLLPARLSGQESTKIDSLKMAIRTETDTIHLADQYIKLANLYTYSNSDSSLLYSQKALALSKQINYTTGEGTALFLISYVYDQAGKWDKGIKHLEEAIRLFTQTNDSVSLIACYLNIGVFYSYGKDQVKALKYIIKSKEVSEDLDNNYALSEIYSNIGSYYQYLKEYRSALRYHEKALEIDLERKNIDNQCLTHTSIGYANIKLRRPKEAFYHFNEALKLIPELQDKHREAEVLLGFLLYYVETGNLSTAKTYLDKTNQIAREQNFTRLFVDIYYATGKFYFKSKSYHKAINFFDKAINNSKNLERFDYLSDYYDDKAKALAAVNKLDEAYKTITQGQEALKLLKPAEIAAVLGEFEQKETIRTERKKLELEQELAAEKTKSDQFRFRTKAALTIATLLLILIALSSYLILRKKHTDELKANYNTINRQKLLLEENLKKLAKDEKDLKRLNATKDKFFSIIAHDLKNPFNVLIGISDLLKNEKEAKNSDDFDFLIDGMFQAATSGYELLENLLEWSRTQTGAIKYEPQSFFIHKVFQTNENLFLETAKTKDLTISISEKKAMAFADFDMTNFIVRNLLNNAIKFSNKGGKIDLNASTKDNKLVVTVKDEGIGMSEETLNNLFKIEMQVQRDGTANEKGTGLGLILCQEFIKINNGQIWVESEPGKGSKFHFSLPLSLS